MDKTDDVDNLHDGGKKHAHRLSHAFQRLHSKSIEHWRETSWLRRFPSVVVVSFIVCC